MNLEPDYQRARDSSKRLQIAIGASIGLHIITPPTLYGLYLLFQFILVYFGYVTPPSPPPTLDVTLINARSANKPANAQVIAQANFDGGGSTDEDRRTKTPLPPTEQQTTGDDIQQMNRRVAELEAAQQRLLAKTKSSQALAPSLSGTSQPDSQPTINGQDLLETAKAMARLEGEISKSIEEYNKRPRKLFPGIRALASERAAYEDAWRQKVERIGTLNYPPEARGKVYGSLVLSVTVDREGNVVEVTIDKSSGQKVLDDAAKRIVRMGSPYGNLPNAIRQQYDNLVIVRTWSFTQGNTLEARQ